jgi:peptidoglycan/LPS O-acetylase OafA/YrhL
LAPVYWVSVLLSILVWVGSTSLRASDRTAPTLGLIASHLVYAQRAFGYPHLEPIYWTLCLEVQFYVLFAAAWVVFGKRVGWLTVALAMGHVGSVVLAATMPSEDWFGATWYLFSLGIAAHRCGTRELGRVSFVLLFLVPVLVLLSIILRPGPLVGVVVAGLLAVGSRRGTLGRWLAYPWLLRLGLISYSVYLFHTLVGNRVVGLGTRLLPPTEWAGYVVFLSAVVVSVTAAALAYRVVERPCIRLSRRIRPTVDKPATV